MSGPIHVLRTLIRVLPSEGIRAVRDRAADRRADRLRLESMRRIDGGDTSAASAHDEASVLNLSPIPPTPRRGGSQLELLDRLDEEERLRPVALLYPGAGGWTMERRRHGVRGELWSLPTPAGAGLQSTATVAAVVARAARLAGSRAVHIAHLHGLPLELPQHLVELGLGVLLSLHDFACFCRRPHLIELPANQFCDYSVDDQRCRRCLTAAGGAEPFDQAAHRRLGGSALCAAERVICPSRFLLERHEALFPEAMGGGRGVVLEPATHSFACRPGAVARRPHLALVGGIKHHKGGAIAGELVDRTRQQLPRLECTSFGDGDPELLAGLRRRHRVRVRGYYRAGHLTRLLVEMGVTAAVLPSVWPESYALVVDECLRVGIPVATFDLGAVGDRLRRLGVGHVADPAGGVEALARATLAALADGPFAAADLHAELPTPATAAERMVELYESLGLV